VSDPATGLLVIAAYFLLAQMLRKQFVADPLRGWARSRLACQRRRLAAMPDCHDDAYAVAVRRSTLEMLDDAEKALEPAGRFAPLREFFSWSGSREAGALSAAHEAERQIVAWLLPDISVHGRVQRARCELQSLPDGQRELWSDTLDRVELGRPDVVRATIGEMLADVYSRRDTAYAELWSLKNKIAWFEWAGLLAAVLIVCRGQGMLLFAGAVGGLLSRMQRALKRRPIRTDYGFSWSLIFLSPMAGALGAWAGMYLILGLEKSGIVADASASFGAHPLTHPTTAVIAVAILLGISERFLDRVVALAGHSIVPEIDPVAATSAPVASVETLRPAWGT